LGQLPEDIRPGGLGAGSAAPEALAIVAPASLPPSPPSPPASLAEAKRAASDEAERACLERGLKDVGGTVAELARRWDMNRSHLQILLKKHGLHSKDFRQRGP
jgi:DNA-binding NtrC family response regulator